MNLLKMRNKDPDKGNSQEKWLLKPRTVDKYTIISITMHLICVYAYNILDFGFFCADPFGNEKEKITAYLRYYIYRK